MSSAVGSMNEEEADAGLIARSIACHCNICNMTSENFGVGGVCGGEKSDVKSSLRGDVIRGARMSRKIK